MVMVIDSLFAFQIVSTNAVRAYGIWAMVSTPKLVPTLDSSSPPVPRGRLLLKSGPPVDWSLFLLLFLWFASVVATDGGRDEE